jgi:hypothetical protein
VRAREAALSAPNLNDCHRTRRGRAERLNLWCANNETWPHVDAPIDHNAATGTGRQPDPPKRTANAWRYLFLDGECQPTLCDATAMGETGRDRWLCMTIPASQPVSPMIMR